MTVKDLRELLATLPDNTQIVFKPENSDYVEDFDRYKRKMIKSFWGNDFEAFVMISDGQAGCVDN